MLKYAYNLKNIYNSQNKPTPTFAFNLGSVILYVWRENQPEQGQTNDFKTKS